MATLLEDERDALEERRLAEQERLQLEEAAFLEQQAIAAQQQQSLPPIPMGGNYMNQPQGEIDALQAHFNEIAQGRGLPAPRTTDSQEYLDEVASAQRNSGFLAPNVSDFGKVISAGYDPMRDPVAIKAQQEATNLQRQNYVDSLIKGGATYAEAYRAGQGRYPQTGNEAMRLKVEQLAQKTQPFTPQVRNIGGQQMIQISPNQWRPVQQEKFVGGKVTPAIRAAEDNLVKQIASLRTQLNSKGLGGLPIPEEEAAALRAEITRKEKERIDLMSKPEVNPNVHQPGWLRIRDEFNNPSKAPVPASAQSPKTVIKYDKSGKAWIVDPESKKVLGPA